MSSGSTLSGNKATDAGTCVRSRSMGLTDDLSRKLGRNCILPLSQHLYEAIGHPCPW